MQYRRNQSADTDLYLVRIWRGRTKGDSAPGLHGKVQHVSSGESCYFDALPDLPQALEQLMKEREPNAG